MRRARWVPERMRRPLSLSAALALALGASAASAQPAGAQQAGAPQGYGPPGGYNVPSPYYYPPPVNLIPPPILPYEEGAPIPPGYALRSRADRSLLVAGSITFGAPYILSALVAGSVVSSDATLGGRIAPLFIPCIGPFITIGTARAESAPTVWLLLDGLAQSGGVALFITGLVAHESYLKRAASLSQPTALLKPEVLVGPGTTQLKWRF
jgi:hypothetical protein